MKTAISVNEVTFDKLIDLFVRRSQNKFILTSPKGKGYVQVFELEKGLQARFWDCCSHEGIEIHSDVGTGIENSYFTLAFFLDTKGVQFANKGSLLPQNIIWDTLFISAASTCKMYIEAKARVNCVGISFSKKWLYNNVFKDNEAFTILKEKIETTKSFSLLESMSLSEKEMIKELLFASWKKSLGSFYIKSAVLKIISDFFHKLKEKETFNTNSLPAGALILEIEKYLDSHVTTNLPNLKDLANKFSLSESTLKRHFKKRHGLNMSTYFIHKKMEYARHLIHEENISISETASLLGYRNVNNFISMYKKYQGSLVHSQ